MMLDHVKEHVLICPKREKDRLNRCVSVAVVLPHGRSTDYDIILHEKRGMKDRF